MHDHDSYPVHRCAFAAVFAVFVVLFVAHGTRRFRQFPVQGEPAPRPHDIKPICSFGVLRDIASKRADGFISGNGTWKRDSKGVPEHFQPEICRFRHKIRIPKQEIRQCIRQEILYYVVFAGDSNSMRYFDAFRALLAGDGAHCVPTQVYYASPVGVRYFARNVFLACQSSHISKPQSNLRQLFMHACCSWLRIGSPLTLYFRFGMTSYLRTMAYRYDS